jgi:hypothetical protein
MAAHIYEINSQNVQYANIWMGGATGEHRKAHTMLLSERKEGFLVGIIDGENPGWASSVDTRETGETYLKSLGFTSADGEHWSK